MSKRVTLIQGLLLVMAGLVVAVLVLVVRQEASPNTEAAPMAATPDAEEDPRAVFVRQVTAASDSLNDAAERLALWLATAPDTSGLTVRADSLQNGVDEALNALATYRGVAPDEDLDLLSSLYLDYLEAPLLAEEPIPTRPLAVKAWLEGLEESRGEIEGRLMRYIGAF